jgi:hypothetical protein
MSHAKRASLRKRRGKAMPVLGAVGLLALASGASAEAPVDTSKPNTGVSQQVFLGEEEISDVSLAPSCPLKSGRGAGSRLGTRAA